MERLPGFRDFYPHPLPTREAWSAELRRHIFDGWRTSAKRYGFREYDGPPLESLELYTAKSGDEIVGQLYNFQDKGDRSVALRPEMTPTLARMVAAHERQYKKPIKWFCIPQLFRYERQQKGRLREHFQLNADIVGEADGAADAELIALAIDSLRLLGLTSDDFRVRLSSRNAWRAFIGARGGDDAEADRFYRIIDKLERESNEVSAGKLKEIGFSLEDVHAFIGAAEPTEELRLIVDNLAARGLAEFVEVDYGVIRGLAYYTGPVFEVFDRKGKFRAIAGGGRYDNLIKLVSKSKIDLPALGFGMGDVVLAELLKDRGLAPDFGQALDAYVLIEEESLRSESLELVQQFRESGLRVDYSLTRLKSDKQFKRALELGAISTARLVRSPSGALMVALKNLASRRERQVAPQEVVEELRRPANPGGSVSTLQRVRGAA